VFLQDTEIEEPSALKVESSKSFSEIVKGLDDFYPEQKRSDISVAFCFICVLHLANEQNLKIETKDHLTELVITQASH
jgi:condensin complex subunit 2